MPSPKQVLVAAEFAESALVKAAPGVWEKLALSAPEIFGSEAKNIGKNSLAAKGNEQVLEDLATSFQKHLEKFGLSPAQTPAKLWHEAESVLPRTAQRVGGKGHVASSEMITLSDGSALSRHAGAGRSGSTETHVFELPGGRASISENKSSFFGDAQRHTIAVTVPGKGPSWQTPALFRVETPLTVAR